MVMTRADYMADDCHKAPGDSATRNAVHRRYYAQLVNEATIASVVRMITTEKLLASTDPHFNDIPLARWVFAGECMTIARRFEDLGDYATKAGLVCVAKEAAQQWLDRQQEGAQ